MATAFSRSLLELILRIGSFPHTGFPKTFLYPCPLPWCRKTYMMSAWNQKHLAKEHTDLCVVESNVGVVLNYVTDAAVAVPPGNRFEDFRDYDNSKEKDDQPATDLLEIFKALGFAKSEGLWPNSEPISLSLPNKPIQTQKHPYTVESSAPQVTRQDMNELTHCVMFEGAR